MGWLAKRRNEKKITYRIQGYDAGWNDLEAQKVPRRYQPIYDLYYSRGRLDRHTGRRGNNGPTDR